VISRVSFGGWLRIEDDEPSASRNPHNGE
jgi:hypothetical protein